MSDRIPPGETAAIDQARAGTDAQLDALISHARRNAAAKGRTRAMADVALSLELAQDPAGYTRGLLLAAIWRLAWPPEDPGDETGERS